MANYEDWESLEETHLPKDRPSNSQVKKAGKVLSKCSATSDKYEEAYDTLIHWRGLHIHPLKSMKVYFNKKALEVTDQAIVVCRLKRVPSIIAKLQRGNRFALNRLEDISGARIIVPTLENVKNIEGSITADAKYKESRRRDYLDHPKPTGYRGMHIIYKYDSTPDIYRGLHTELQIRSYIQHAWATAVEIVDTFTVQTLKAGVGQEKWLTFFKIVGNAFASIEDKQYRFNKSKELKDLETALGVIDKLNAFNVTADCISDYTSEYFILNLNTEARKITLSHFLTEDIDAAQAEYEKLERMHKDDKNIDVALVSSKSIKELKQAYPNYFADTKIFINCLGRFL